MAAAPDRQIGASATLADLRIDSPGRRDSFEGDDGVVIKWRCEEAFIFIPAGMPHGFRVGRVASRKLNLYSPAAMVGYFDEIADAGRTGEVKPEVLSQIARRYSMEVIGPVPEGYL